jgi:hypothetical protein
MRHDLVMEGKPGLERLRTSIKKTHIREDPEFIIVFYVYSEWAL